MSEQAAVKQAIKPAEKPVERAAEWVYRGLWRVLSDWFRVPEHPPTLPVEEGEFSMSFHPSRQYLKYQKLYFWIALAVIDVAILVGWLILLAVFPLLAAILAIPALLLAVVPDIIAYIAIHLRYDTMWYVMTDRSLRTRRGIWWILEHTITFENVQDVYVKSGPIQQLFGISEIIVETAGADEGEGENKFAVGNKAIMEGIGNPAEIRTLIMDRVRASKGAGLGEEASDAAAGWSPEHVAVLREIESAVRPDKSDGGGHHAGLGVGQHDGSNA